MHQRVRSITLYVCMLMRIRCRCTGKYEYLVEIQGSGRQSSTSRILRKHTPQRLIRCLSESSARRRNGQLDSVEADKYLDESTRKRRRVVLLSASSKSPRRPPAPFLAGQRWETDEMDRALRTEYAARTACGAPCSVYVHGTMCTLQKAGGLPA